MSDESKVVDDSLENKEKPKKRKSKAKSEFKPKSQRIKNAGGRVLIVGGFTLSGGGISRALSSAQIEILKKHYAKQFQDGVLRVVEL